ncbi:GTPase activating protein (GAP) [Coemansia aciculifera]|uniref:GTPase activating protein (GAP) n=1 Tax=Coemansia aciculifera TaxID=417176 RepID=A0A9W8IQJ0_9FUNG|nr:GTPase activating protein (GAP) [Coemansia aciculifera]
MFVLPAPAEPSAFWSDVKYTENFVLQQSASAGGAFLRNVLATIQNVLETKPPPFRIVYRHVSAGDTFILLGAGETREEIEADWKWLYENIMPVVSDLEDPAERASFVVTKIRFLATAEGGQDVSADRKMRAAATTFRQTFDVGRSENLVTYYSCALQRNFMLHQGWLYLSEHFFCFYSYMFGSEKKIIFELRDIKDLAKAKSMGGVRDDAIEVVTKDGSRYAFSNLFHRDETFDMLSQLTANTMKRVLLNSEYASTQHQSSGGHKRNPSAASALSTGARQPVVAPVAQRARSLAEQISQQRRNEEFQGEFGLPGSETLLSVIDAASMSIPGSINVYLGKLYLSTSFVCYMSRDFRGCRIILPLAAVRRIERTSSTDSHFVQCYELSITVWHQMDVSFKVPLDSTECNRWCDALRGQLKTMVEEQRVAKASQTALSRYTLRAFCKTCASEYLLTEEDGEQTSSETEAQTYVDCLGKTFGFPGDPRAQKEKPKRRYWLKYMRDYGRNLTIIRRAEFDRLIRVGLPNCLRGEIWELSSGAMYLRFQNRGVYEKYVNDYLDRPGPYADEIEKDLNRSLPEYAGYQSPEGIDALRRVLNAYSLRDSELGYCQAMNIVASTMLIFMTEEQVFWTLTVMCDRLVPGYYSPSMYGASLDQSIFQTLVEDTMPVLATSFKKRDIQLSIACLPWFLTLFVNSMPLVYALRVLDCFFLEGPKILFRIGLAILKINGGALLEATDDGVFLFVLKEYYSTLGDLAYPDSKNMRARQVTKFHELLYVAYSDFPTITHGRIEELRRSHQLRIVHSVEEFSKRTFLRNVIDSSGFTKEQLSLLYDRYYSVLFYARGLGTESGSLLSPTGGRKENEASAAKITLDVYAFARFMYEISSWMRVQIKEARERTQNHRNVSLADTKRKSPASSSTGLSGGNGGRDNGGKSKIDDVSRETTASLENPGWFVTSLFRYASRIVPPVSRLHAFDTDSDGSASREVSAPTDLISPTADEGFDSLGLADGAIAHDDSATTHSLPATAATTAKPAAIEPAALPTDDAPIESLRVSFQQCVIALGRIVNTDLLTRMDVFFDMYAMTMSGAINRKEMFQLSEAILYIGHGEDVETGASRHSQPTNIDITNEERLLRSVSEFLRRAVSYGENEDLRRNDGRRADFVLPRNMFRVVVLEDEMLEQFFSEMVPASFRFTDGVELSNPLRAISTHLPVSPTTPRNAESASARILAGGRSVAEGMSARVAQTIALGSQFVDQRVLTPIVRGAALSEGLVAKAWSPGASNESTGFAVSDDLAKSTLLANAEPSVDKSPSERVADDMARMSLGGVDGYFETAARPTAGLQQQRLPAELQENQWVNAPQDPYENLLDEVDQLLGEIKDDDDSGTNVAKPVAATAIADLVSDIDDVSDFEVDVAHGGKPGNNKIELDLCLDDDSDDDLAHLLTDKS